MKRKVLRSPLWFALAGSLAGLFAGLTLGVLLLALLDAPAITMAPSQPPERYDVHVSVEEHYINRIMVEGSGDVTRGVRLVAGHLDLRTGELVDFQTQIKLGPLEPVVVGTLGFRVSASHSLEIVLLEAKMGRLNLTRLVPQQALEGVNRDIERQILDRVGSTGMQLFHVSTEDDALHLYLRAAE